MAPIKFEEQIKDKLEQRSLEPSIDAWSKLSLRLDDDKNNRKNPLFWWFGIAASIAVLLMVSISIFNTIENPNIEQIVAEDKAEDNQNSENDILIESKETVEIVKNAPVEKPVEPLKVIKEPTAKKDKVIILPKNRNTSVAKAEPTVEDIKNSFEAPKAPNDISKEMMDTELKAVVSQFQNIQDKNNTVTDRQIDSLLKAASKALLRDKLYKKGTNVVNADALLQDVEDDLDQSFRTRIYEALKSGFKEVKTAVANRNNQ